MKKIAIIIGNSEREKYSAQFIIEEIRKNRDVDVLGPIEFGSLFTGDLVDYNPNIILCPNITCELYRNALFFIKRVCHCCVVTFTTEGMVNFFNESNINDFAGKTKYSQNLVDYEICWGCLFAATVTKKRIQQKKLYGIDRVRVIGNPLYEKDKIEKLGQAHYFDKLKLDDKKVVMFLTGFQGKYYDRQCIVEAGDILDSTKDISSQIEKYCVKLDILKKYAYEYYNLIRIISQKGYHVIIKLHPMEMVHQKQKHNYEKFYDEIKLIPNVKVIDEPIPIGKILPYVDSIFHYGSTVSLEAYYYGVRTARLYSEQNDIVKLGFATPHLYEKTIAISEIEEVERFIEEKADFISIPYYDDLLSRCMNISKNQKYEPSKSIANYILEKRCVGLPKIRYGECSIIDVLRRVYHLNTGIIGKVRVLMRFLFPDLKNSHMLKE